MSRGRTMLRLMTTWNWNAVDINFDYVVNLANTLTDNKEEFELISTSYTPVLRYQLESQNLNSANVWSLYDELQGITIKNGQPITLADLALPENAEIIYTPFGINVYYLDQIYARLVPYNDAILCQVIYFANGQQDVIDYYDDRGFLSRRDLLATPDEPAQSFYFNQQGQLMLSEQVTNTGNGITIYPVAYSKFKQKNYATLQAVLIEVFDKYAHSIQEPFIVTVNDVTPTEFIQKVSLKYPIIPYLEQATLNTIVADTLTKQLRELLVAAKNVVIPEQEAYEKLIAMIKSQKLAIDLKKIKVITPYAIQLDLGLSNTLVETNILVNATKKTAAETIKIIKSVLELMLKDTDLTLIMAVENSTDTQLMMTSIKEYLNAKLAINGDNPDLGLIEEYVLAKQANKPNPDLLKAIRELEKKNPIDYNNMVTLVQTLHNISFEKNLNKDKWHQLILKARLYVDLDNNLDLYPAMQAIETGIPLLLAKKVEFLHEPNNGAIIQTLKQLNHYLDKYVYELNVWNDTLVYDVKLGSAYSDTKLITKWKEVGYGKGKAKN